MPGQLKVYSISNNYLRLVLSISKGLARGKRGDGMVGEEAARGDGPDHGGNLKLVPCAGL